MKMHEAMPERGEGRREGGGEGGEGKGRGGGREGGDSSHSAGGIVKLPTKTMNSRGVRRHM